MNTWSNYDWSGLLEKVAIALVILIATWIIARIARWALTKLIGGIGFLQSDARDGESLAEAIGQIGSLVVWLFGLVAILQVFALDRVLTPIQGMLAGVLSYVPNIIGAGFVFFIGYVIARIVRQITTTALDTAGLDSKLGRLRQRTASEGLGDSATPGLGGSAGAAAGTSESPRLSNTIANLLFAVILIVVAIAALQILGISAISDPAEQMLTTILDAIPRIIAAALLFGLGYVIARFAGQLLETTLGGLGVDRSIAGLGIVPEGRSSSTILARIAQVAILLFFAVMAAQMLNFPVITEILHEILTLGGRVLFGGAIIAAGVIAAGLLRRTVGRGTAGTIAYWATTALFVAMGLSYMGIADSIINLAFGAAVVGTALAAALAYGIGGRDAAARSLQRLQTKVESRDSGGDPI